MTLPGVKERGRTPVATNRKARHLYVVLDTVEAGIVLVGNEVKSLRLHRASLGEAFATVEDHEMWLHNLHIAEYAFARGRTTLSDASASCSCTAPRS